MIEVNEQPTSGQWIEVHEAHALLWSSTYRYNACWELEEYQPGTDEWAIVPPQSSDWYERHHTRWFLLPDDASVWG